MPFEKEKAGYASIRRIMASKKVKSLQNRFKFVPHDTQDEDSTLPPAKPEDANNVPNIIIATDGSYHSVDMKDGYPGAEMGYITTASVVLFLDKLKESNKDGFINPVKFREASKTGSIDIALPGRGIIIDSEKSAKFSMRKTLFEEMSDYRIFDSGESLLDTYEHLADLRETEQKPQCPCDEENRYQYKKGHYTCPEQGCDVTLYSTDAMRIHELFSDIDSCEKMYGQTMILLERLLLIHTLRSFEKKGEKWLPLLGEMAFVLDGPMAIYGASAWLSTSFRKELERINEKQKKITKRDMIIISIEKTGSFARHLEMIDTDKEGTPDVFPRGHYRLINNEYIRKYIQPSDGSRDYGRNTYFGRKFFYKSLGGHRLVVNTACYTEEQMNIKTAEESQYVRLYDTIKLLEELSSSMYPNSISALIAAHAEAAIPLRLGHQVLDKIAKERIQPADE